MKKAAFFVLTACALAGISSAIVACAERCQINDPRPMCNAYGNPDKYKDANFVSTSDASPE